MRDVRRECSTITRIQAAQDRSFKCMWGGGGGVTCGISPSSAFSARISTPTWRPVQLSGTFDNLRDGRALSNLQNACAHGPHLPFKAVTVQEPTSRHRCLCVKQRKMQFATPPESNLSGSLGDRPRARAGGGSSSTRRYNGCIQTAAFLQSLFVTFFVSFSKCAGNHRGAARSGRQHWNKRLLSFCVALSIATAARTRAAATTPAHTLTVLHHVTRICL